MEQKHVNRVYLGGPFSGFPAATSTPGTLTFTVESKVVNPRWNHKNHQPKFIRKKFHGYYDNQNYWVDGPKTAVT